jgi:hypothetical protein
MMNTLHKSLTIAILIVTIFISSFNIDLVGAQNTTVGTAASRRPVDLILSPYLKFRRAQQPLWPAPVHPESGSCGRRIAVLQI